MVDQAVLGHLLPEPLSARSISRDMVVELGPYPWLVLARIYQKDETQVKSTLSAQVHVYFIKATLHKANLNMLRYRYILYN